MPQDSSFSGLARYHRQMLLPGMGEAGQRRLLASSSLLVGCGALGTVIAESLVRAGVGRLRIVDRDIVELTNLQRQTLFIESDANEALPKAIAAARRLRQVNSEVNVEPVVADFSAINALGLAADVDVLIDGTDNFETRLLINDLAVKLGKPYVYGGAVGTIGTMYVVLPGESCLRCLVEEAPFPGAGPTCDTAGVLGPVAGVVANIQAAEAIKLLSGNIDAVTRELISVDLWSGRLRAINVSGTYEPGRCVCCGQRRFEYLEGDRGSRTFRLCGRNAVQISTSAPGNQTRGMLDLSLLESRLASHGPVKRSEHLLRVQLHDSGREFQLTLFPDGRVLIHGTADPALARAIYARYIGI